MRYIMKHKYPFVVLLLAIFYVVTGVFFYQYYYDVDFWAYPASLREIAGNFIHPANPHILSEAPSTWYSPYIVLWALVHKLTGIDIFHVLGVAGVVNFLIIAGGLSLFIREYFSDDDLPLPVLVTMLFFWGKGWDFSGCFDLDFLRTALCYPYAFAMGLTFICFYLVLRFLKTGRAATLFSILLVFELILLTHIITASFCFLSVSLIVFFRSGVSMGKRAIAVAALGAAVPLAALWPYFPFFRAILLSMAEGTPYSSELHSEVLLRMGPLLLGVPVALYYAAKKKHVFPAIWLFACSAVYVVSFFTKDSVGSRYVFFAAFVAAVLIGLFVRDAVVEKKKGFVHAYVALLALCVAYQGAKIGLKYAGYRSMGEVLAGAPSAAGNIGNRFLGKFSFLPRHVGDAEVVLSDPHTAWLTPSFAGKSVSMFWHFNPFVPDGFARSKDDQIFFATDTGDEFRRAAIKRYGADFLLLNLRFVDERLSAGLKRFGAVVHSDDNFILIRTVR